MLMGTWFLVALIILAVNGIGIMSLLDPTILGISPQVRLAAQKWQQLKSIGVERVVLGDAGLSFDRRLYVSPPKNIPSQPMVDVPKPEQVTTPPPAPESVELPPLSGIVKTLDMLGTPRFSAFIDGRRVGVKDRINGFDLVYIGEDGVILSRNGVQWFVPVPVVNSTVLQESRLTRHDTDAGNESIGAGTGENEIRDGLQDAENSRDL